MKITDEMVAGIAAKACADSAVASGVLSASPFDCACRAARAALTAALAQIDGYYVIPKEMTDAEWQEVKYNVDRKANPDIPLWRIQEAVKWAAFETSHRAMLAAAPKEGGE